MTVGTEPVSDRDVETKRPGGGQALWLLLIVALFLLGAGSFFVAESLERDPVIEPVGGNLPVNGGAADPGDLSAHNSPTVVRNPRDEANLAIGNRIDSPNFSCALHVSLDGGSSWRQTPLPIPPGEQPKCYAPDAAFDSDGTLYVSFVTLAGRGNVPNAVWISSSDDGGLTLSDPEQALGDLAFQVRLTADPTKPRRLYLTWLQVSGVGLFKFTAPGNPILAMSSDDGGLTWTDPAEVNDADRDRVLAPSVAAGEDGRLYVLFLDVGDDRLDYEGAHEGQGGPPYGGTFELVLARSNDRGETWEESVVEDELTPTERFIAFLPPFPSLALDSANGRLYAAFHDARLGDSDVWLWVSEDDGVSWGSPVRINDTAEKDGTTQRLPKAAVAPDGRVDVVYYDGRADEEDVMTEVSFQSSFDGGATFEPSVTLVDRPFDSRVGYGSERDMPDLGSRLGLVSADHRSLAVWTDTRSGSRVSGKQDLVQAVVEVSGGGGLPEWARLALLGVAALCLVAAATIIVWRLVKRRAAL